MRDQAVDPGPLPAPPLALPRSFRPLQEAAVAAFLRDRPFLLPLLAELRREVDAHFGPWTPVLLDLRTDPEEGDTALFARIDSGLPIEDAMARHERVVRMWWLESLARSDAPMHIDVLGR